jgi:hypothetical protein
VNQRPPSGDLAPWEHGAPGRFVITLDGVALHWRVDDHGLPGHPEVRLQLDIESLMAGEIEPDGACWATERDVSAGPDLVGRAFDAVREQGLTYAGRRPQEAGPTSDQPLLGRDPDRIPMILAALERSWMKQPDARLGQLIMNLLRMNTNILREDEGKVLFNVEDGALLGWLGPDSEAEETYIEQEPGKARAGWKAWELDYIRRQRAKGEDEQS